MMFVTAMERLDRCFAPHLVKDSLDGSASSCARTCAVHALRQTDVEGSHRNSLPSHGFACFTKSLRSTFSWHSPLPVLTALPSL